MASPLKTLVQDFPWIHLGLGLLGNFAFFVGSFLFLPSFEEWKLLGVWLFIIGAGLMLVGSLGALAARIYDRIEERHEEKRQQRRPNGNPAAAR